MWFLAEPLVELLADFLSMDFDSDFLFEGGDSPPSGTSKSSICFIFMRR